MANPIYANSGSCGSRIWPKVKNSWPFFFLEGTNYDSNIFVKSEKPKLACSSGVKMQLAQIT